MQQKSQIFETKNSRFLVISELPPEFAPEILSLVQQHLKILPSWLKELWLIYDVDTPGEWLASSNTNYEYRTHTIRFGCKFLAISHLAKELAIIHEMFHAVVSPLTWCREEFARLLEDAPKYSQTLERGFVNRVESVVSDLTYGYFDHESQKEGYCQSREIVEAGK